LYLKRLEIQGFKSLADKIDLQFNQGITAVVGPNGSGKSNIADAVRWVLGEQSVKSLRGARMEDVIFSGSDRRKPVGMAEVSLTLDNSSSVFPLDYSEITITRRVYRSGESEYLLNKASCRLRDIHELFMDTGIGREGYSIIGQGKIDEILSTKSEDRRTIIEEAAGIVKYKTRKQKAVKKLTDTEQNLVRISDIISELETQAGPLEEQSIRAREYLGYREELCDLEINVLVNQIVDQKQKMEEMKTTEQELNRNQIESETFVRSLESEIEELKLAAGKLEEEVSSMQKEIYSTGNLMEKKEAEITVSRERAKDIDRRRKYLGEEIIELSEKEKEEKERHSGDEEALAGLRERINKDERDLAENEEKLICAEAGFLEEQKRIEERKADIIELLNDMAGTRNGINSGETEINNLKKRLGQLEMQHERLLAELKDNKERETALNRKITGINEKIETVEDQKLDSVRKRDDLGSKLVKMNEEAAGKRELLQQKKSRLSALKELQKDYEGYFKGVREVLVHYRGKDKINGIHGVMAEKIRVPAEFETAVEVALGSSLQHIITQTDVDARDAIEFLKKNKAGRATFLPLNTIKPARGKDSAVPRIEGVFGRAAELVQYDDIYKDIVEYLLGRVIIVRDIRDAVEISKATGYSMKTVTLDGDVVNPGGSMTGGSYRKGSSNLLGRMREIEETSGLAAHMDKELQDLAGHISGLQVEYENCEKQIKSLDIELHELFIEKNSTAKDLDITKQDRARIDSSLNLIVDEKTVIGKDIENAEGKINDLRLRLNELQLMDESARNSINELLEKLADREEEKARLAETVTGIRVKLAGMQQEELNYAQIMDRVAQTIEEIKKQVQKKDREIKDLDTQQEALGRQIECLETEIRELSQEKGQREEILNRLKNEKQALSGEIFRKEGEVKALSKEISQLREQAHASDVRMARIEFDIENSLAKLAEEFQVTFEEALLKKSEIKNKRETMSRIRMLKESILALGNVNVGAVEEYERVKERYDFLSRQYADLEQAKESLYKVINEMEQIMTRKFREAFSEINRNFGEVFAKLFGGGKAELIMTDYENLLESGIDIMAQPPGKKNQHLSLLSGGERALTAISLLFAILRTKPSPFCVLDEIEASLDEANVDRFAEYLMDIARNTQFIVITHRKGTMEVANILYGVTMDESSVTKMVSMKLSDAVSKVS